MVNLPPSLSLGPDYSDVHGDSVSNQVHLIVRELR